MLYSARGMDSRDNEPQSECWLVQPYRHWHCPYHILIPQSNICKAMRQYMGNFQVLEVATCFRLKELSVVVCGALVLVKTSSSLRYVKLPTHNASMAITDETVMSQERYALFCASWGPREHG